MAINFSALPTDNPYSAPEPGFYKGKIVKTEMKQPKDVSKKQYLAVTYDLTDKNGKSAGKLFDNIFDSDTPALQYKLGRLALACKLPMTGVLELKDLGKIIVNKEVVLELEHDKEGRAQVALFKNEVFYPIEKFAELVGLAVDEELPFTADSTVPVPEPSSTPGSPVEY